MIEVLMQLGELLRSAREKLGLTMEQLEMRTGLTHGYISLYERDKRIPSDQTLRLIARELEVDFEVLRDAAENARFTRDMQKIYRKYNMKVDGAD